MENYVINVDKVEDIMYSVKNEFENEIDSIEDTFDKKLTDKELDFAFELLNGYINKTILIIKDNAMKEDNTGFMLLWEKY